jgi:hypothetical protein
MLERGFAVPDLALPALPPPVSWFPLPAGWWVSGILLVVALNLFVIFRIARWRRNIWRREAYKAIQRNLYVDDWLCLIKRILLIHLPRESVSRKISPASFLRYVPIDDDLRLLLSTKYCQRDNDLDDDQALRLRSQVFNWLKGLPDV